MASLAKARGGLKGRRGAAAAPGAGEDLREVCRTLLRTRGEASVVTLARGALDAFARLDGGGRREFFRFLAHELGPEPAALERAVEAYREAPGPETAAALARAAEPPRRELLGLLNTSPNGMSDLLAMREALLDALPAHPELRPLDEDFLYLLRAWFNRGFLELRRIDWRTPAFVLEKIIEYEAVHEILDWEDLQRRLEADRRCFGFFHPSLPDEPSSSWRWRCAGGSRAPCRSSSSGRWSRTSRRTPRCSIRSATASAASSGSPSATSHQAGGARAGGRDAGASQVRHPVAHPRVPQVADPAAGEGRLAGEGDLGDVESPDWPSGDLGPRVLRLCARYLLHEKRGRQPLDPVARFHLRNGARLEQLNWMADPSRSGLIQSGGVMVNYVYDDAEVVANHEAYVNEGRIAHAGAVAALADEPLE